MLVKLCKAGALRPSKSGRATYVNVQLILIEVEGSKERLAFNKIAGTTNAGSWQIFDDDLDALHRSLSISG